MVRSAEAAEGADRIPLSVPPPPPPAPAPPNGTVKAA